MIPTGILLSYLTRCRLVSLFDTRVKIKDNPMAIKQSEGISIHSDRETSGERSEDNMILDTDDEIDHGKLKHTAPSHPKRQTKRVLEKANEDTGNSTNSDTDSSVFSDGEKDEDSDTDYSAFDNNNDLDRFSDDSDVTDNEYDAGPEETGTIIWRHIAFYVVRSPVPGRPNILLAKITLLHTKGENNKPRV
jgi:hypothetical protein